MRSARCQCPATVLPWLKRSHNDLVLATGERLGTCFAAFVADEARESGEAAEALGSVETGRAGELEVARGPVGLGSCPPCFARLFIGTRVTVS